MIEPAVALRGLTKRYGDVVALDDLTIEIPRGVVFGLLGPNGAGKTTSLRLLAGLARATSGEVRIGGRPVGSQDGAGARIGYLDQDPRFYGWMSGRELVTLVGRLHGLAAAVLMSRVDESLERVGLQDAARRRISGYSGGMRQRLGIAQALVHRPELVVLDEPVNSLDPEGRRDLLTLIAELRGEATVIVSSHVLADIERIADRIAILDHGRLAVAGPLAEILERFAQPVFHIEIEPGQAAAAEAFIVSVRRKPWAAGVESDGAVVRVAATDAEAAAIGILTEAVAARLRLAMFERQRPTLEDVFLRLVGRPEAAS
jgi:ABC-2 type transport system ATP-binding protein